MLTTAYASSNIHTRQNEDDRPIPDLIQEFKQTVYDLCRLSDEIEDKIGREIRQPVSISLTRSYDLGVHAVIEFHIERTHPRNLDYYEPEEREQILSEIKGTVQELFGPEFLNVYCEGAAITARAILDCGYSENGDLYRDDDRSSLGIQFQGLKFDCSED